MDMVKKMFTIKVDENGIIMDKEASVNDTIFEDNNVLVFSNILLSIQ
jgi:hypothetical protein